MPNIITNIVKEWVNTNDSEYSPTEGTGAMFDDIYKVSYTENGIDRFDILYMTNINTKSDDFLIVGDSYAKLNGAYSKLEKGIYKKASKTEPVNMATGERVPISEGTIQDENGNVIGFVDGYCSVVQYYILAFKPSFEQMYSSVWDRSKGLI